MKPARVRTRWWTIASLLLASFVILFAEPREPSAQSSSTVEADALYKQGLALYQQGRYREAEAPWRRELEIRQNAHGPDSASVAWNLNNLALLEVAQGKLPEAISLHRRALAIREKVLGPEHTDVAQTLNNLAIIYRSQGKLAEAEPLIRRALAIREKVLGPEHAEVAQSLNSLAILYRTQGNLAEAEPLHRRALTIREKVLGPEHADVAQSLNNLAVIYLVQGRLAQAEPLYRRALAIWEKVLGPEHAHVASSLNNLAIVYHKQGKLAEAEPLYRRALAIWEKALGPEQADVARSRMNLALLSFKQGRDSDALNSLRAVATINRKLSASVDDRAAEGAGGEIRFSDDSLVLLAALAERRGNATERVTLLSEAFEAVQLSGVRSTATAVARMAARHAGGSDRLAGLVRQRQDAIDRHRTLDKALLASVGKLPGQRDAQQEQRLRQGLDESDKHLTDIDALLARDFPRYAEIASPAPVPITNVQALLATDEAMLVYRIAADWLLENTTYLWVVRRDRAELIKLPIGRTALERAVASLRTTLDPSEFDIRRAPAFNTGGSHDLYATILGPAVPFLQGAKHLVIVPDGALQSLPFGTLLTEKLGPSGGGSQAKWLVRQYAITTLPSVSSLRALRAFAANASVKPHEPFAGFGDPVLDGRPGDRKGLKVASLYRGIIADADAVRSLDPLPETAGELRAMAKALGSKGDAIWLRDRATEAQAKKADLSKYRVLAFATHGLMADQFRDYGEPALVMTPPKVASEADDGLLGASEITQLKLNADWVILSACNTAAPDGTPGAEGLSGLAKAFFYAGARSLLVSHWPVESESSARLTTGAITALAKEPGIGRAEALRRSMLALMDDPKYAHPMYWAPFVVVGEGGAGR